MEESENNPELANSMLGSLLAAVHQADGPKGVERVLERSGERRSFADLQKPGGWSSYEQGLALFRAAADVLGDPEIGRKAGWRCFGNTRAPKSLPSCDP